MQLYKIKEVAEILAVSERQVYIYMDSGRLSFLKLSSGARRITKEDLEQFVQDCKVEANNV